MGTFSFFKLLGTTAVITTGITSAVAFSSIDSKTYAKVKIMTPEHYAKLKKLNNGKKEIPIDYSTLPATNYTIKDVISGSKNINNGNYIFLFGSQAYAQTNKMLYGHNQDYHGSFTNGITPNISFSQSLMLMLYDRFLKDENKQLELSVPYFLSYLDIVNTRELNEASKLYDKRVHLPSIEGKKHGEDYRTASDVAGNSNDITDKAKTDWWIVNPDPGERIEKEVVKGGVLGNFDFKPTADNFYEFLPNNHKDTKYEKVYYRNDANVDIFLDSKKMMDNYISKNSADFESGSETMSELGSILLVKNTDKDGRVMKVVTIDNNIANIVETIYTFYNPVK